MSGQKISVYTILYYDLQFLDSIFELIYPYVDEIVIIDGPYIYSLEILEKCNLFYDETNRPQELTDLINKYPKIVYKYSLFNCEEEKRILGYNTCTNDNILLVDSDEFFKIDMGNIKRFMENESKFVGRFDIYNMNRANVSYSKKIQKYVLFKKNKISAVDHLDYLWLVGCKTKEKVKEYMDSKTVLGVIYHQTLNRNKFNNIIKFIFYFSLYCNNNNMPISLFDNYSLTELLKVMTIEELLNIFYHCRIESIGIPAMAITSTCVKNNEIFNEIAKFNNNHRTGYYTEPCLGLVNVSAFFLVNETKSNSISISFDNVKSVNITIYEVPFNAPYDKHTFNINNVINNNVVITYNRNITKLLNTVIQFECSSTLDGSNIYKIKLIK